MAQLEQATEPLGENLSPLADAAQNRVDNVVGLRKARAKRTRKEREL